MNAQDYKNNSVRTRYKGDTASKYDKKRAKRKKWKKEINIIKQIAYQLDPQSTIVDIPLGTGRFLQSLQEASHTVYGIDISREMLLQAKSKDASQPVDMILGDAVTVPLKSQSVDYVLCIRLLNWVLPNTAKLILKEFRRVARKGVIVGFRTEHPMSTSEFVKLGIETILPTPTNFSRWSKKILQFSKKAKGKIVHEYRNITGKTRPKTNPHNRMAFINTFHDKDAMFKLFSELGMEVREEHYIDMMGSFSERIARHYSIYVLKIKE